MAYTGKTPVDFVDVTQSQSMAVSDDLTVDTDTLVVDSANNNVGIGTSSPDTLLHLSALDGATLRLESTDVTLGADQVVGAIEWEGNDVTTGSSGVVGKIDVIAEDSTPEYAMRFFTHDNLSGTPDFSERMRIDSDGSVGIGISSPLNYKLHIHDSSNTFAYTKYTNSTTGTTTLDGLTLGMSSANALIYNYESGNIQFATAGIERMRLNSSGDVLVGKTSGGLAKIGHEFDSTGYAYHTRSNAECLYLNRKGSDGAIQRFYNDGTNVGNISVGSSTTSYNTSSDYRLKEDWQPMTGAIERVNALNPVNFAWKVDGSRVDGFLAHEAQEVVPEAVVGKKDEMREEEYEVTPAVLDEDGNVVTEAVMGTRSVPDYQGIDQSKLVPLLTAALQEAIAKIETLETKVAALENA